MVAACPTLPAPAPAASSCARDLAARGPCWAAAVHAWQRGAGARSSRSACPAAHPISPQPPPPLQGPMTTTGCLPRR